MMLAAAAAAEAIGPEALIGFLAILALSVIGLVKFLKWLLSGPVRPDPWDDAIAADIASDNCTPICHRCLSPHSAQVYFCPQCGAPVGTYTNWLPYPYLFSIGHTLRIGTEGTFKRSPLVIVGFFLFSLVEYALFAPAYWYCFLRALSRGPKSNSSGGEQTREPENAPNPQD